MTFGRGDEWRGEEDAAAEVDGVAAGAVNRRQGGSDFPAILWLDLAALRQDCGKRRHDRCAGLRGA